MSHDIDSKTFGQALSGAFGDLQPKDVVVFSQGIALDHRWFDRENLTLRRNLAHVWRGFCVSRLKTIRVRADVSDTFGQSLDGTLYIRDHFWQGKKPKEADFVGVLLFDTMGNAAKSAMLDGVMDRFSTIIQDAPKKAIPQPQIDPFQLAQIAVSLFCAAQDLKRQVPPLNAQGKPDQDHDWWPENQAFGFKR